MKQSQKKSGISCKSAQLPPSHPFQWTVFHKERLNRIVDQLTNTPVMAYPYLDKPFVLHIDASEDGLGAVLYQRQECVPRVPVYGSKILTRAKLNAAGHYWVAELADYRFTLKYRPRTANRDTDQGAQAHQGDLPRIHRGMSTGSHQMHWENHGHRQNSRGELDLCCYLS